MAGIERIHGGVGVEGVINGVSGAQLGGNLKYFKVTVQNVSNSNQDLQPEMAAGVNGGLGGVVETILRVCPSGILAYYVPADSSGQIHLIVDGHATFASTTGSTSQPGLQEIIRALGTAVPTAAGGTMDVTGTDVVAGTSFVIA